MLSGSFTIPEWDPAAITDVLDRLTPRNCQVRQIAGGREGGREEGRYSGRNRQGGRGAHLLLALFT